MIGVACLSLGVHYSLGLFRFRSGWGGFFQAQGRMANAHRIFFVRNHGDLPDQCPDFGEGSVCFA